MTPLAQEHTLMLSEPERALLLTILDKAGVPQAQVGDSTGLLSDL